MVYKIEDPVIWSLCSGFALWLRKRKKGIKKRIWKVKKKRKWEKVEPLCLFKGLKNAESLEICPLGLKTLDMSALPFLAISFHYHLLLYKCNLASLSLTYKLSCPTSHKSTYSSYPKGSGLKLLSHYRSDVPKSRSSNFTVALFPFKLP